MYERPAANLRHHAHAKPPVRPNGLRMGACIGRRGDRSLASLVWRHGGNHRGNGPRGCRSPLQWWGQKRVPSTGGKDYPRKNVEHSQADVPIGDKEASIRNWRREQDLAQRLNCPYCKEKYTNAHYMHFCREPTVVAARRKHRGLLAAATHKCELKKFTARALTANHVRP